jgi:hypothetical protein
MAHKTSRPDAVRPETGSLELTEELIRERAYQIYEERGGEYGHDLDDWLMAEAEIVGKKPSDSEMVYEVAAMSAVAV